MKLLVYLALSAAQDRAIHAERTKAEIEAAAQDRIEAAEAAKRTAEFEAKSAKENHETILNERLQEQREAHENNKEAAIRAEQAKTFDERQRLKAKAVPLNPSEHFELVHWMVRHQFSDHLFLFNAKRRGASIELSSKDARKA